MKYEANEFKDSYYLGLLKRMEKRCPYPIQRLEKYLKKNIEKPIIKFWKKHLSKKGALHFRWMKLLQSKYKYNKKRDSWFYFGMNPHKFKNITPWSY